MTFQQNIARYVIGDTGLSLPDIAMQALEEGLDSPSLRILAGLNHNEYGSVRDEYFRNTLRELSIELPGKRLAAIIVGLIIADEIFESKRDVFEGTAEIINRCIDAYPFYEETRKYRYDSIGFELVYGWFDTIDELQHAGHRWDADKTNKELELEARKELLHELKIWAERMKEELP